MVQGLPELRMTFGDRAALERELEVNLSHGRAFVAASCELSVLDDCQLVLVHPEGGGTLTLPAQAVMVGGAGIGVQLRPFNTATITTLREFVVTPPPAATMPSGAEPGTTPVSPSAAQAASLTPAGMPSEAPAAEEPEEPTDADAADDDELDDACDGAATDEVPEDVQRQAPRHERLRNLNATQQIKLARKGEMNDRIMLERLYGRGVWEALLQNPKLTLPEVATIARKGSVPRPLLETIVENNAWIQSPLVRRALLTNPRVSSEAILKLLRMTPKHEVRSIWKTTTYSQLVRDTAKKVLEM